MIRKKAKKKKTEPRWKPDKVTAKRRTARKLKVSGGLIKYVTLLIISFSVIRFGILPVAAKIKSHPIFIVRNVVVEGASYLDPEKIMELVDISPRTNIFDVDLQSISLILSYSYTAEDFTVYRRLPDTVAIRIDERVPVALVNVRELVGVDANGVTLPHIGAELIETLPIITGIRNLSALSDSSVAKRLQTGLALLSRINDESPSVYKRISEINITKIQELGISLVDNGLEVIIGDTGWDKNLQNLEKVITEITKLNEPVKTVDIRFGEKIFVRKQ
ncbi:Cell division protein FtsQ [subsurface metagenome]